MANIPHSTLTGADLHVPGYIQEVDPGAVGAGILWYKLSTRSLKIRNLANSGWVGVVRVTEKSITTPNGVTKAFSFNNTIVDLDWVTIDGQVQSPDDYTIAGVVITFGSSVPAPESTSKVVAGYWF
jgi:hypothetical protein